MVRIRTKFSAFCFRLTNARLPEHSPPLQSNPAYNSIKTGCRSEYYDNDCETCFSGDTPRTREEDTPKSESKNGNRILVVIDPSQEARGALEWALSHTVQKEDTVILLHIAKPSKRGLESDDDVDPRAYGLLHSMKRICQTRRPGVQVETVVLRGKEKGPLIVEEAKHQRISLLILGHRRRSVAWRLLRRWAGNRKSRGVVDYCIQNANCMTIAVRRKSQKLGGYLITTKRHKNFWLLA
ncbi:hypothetical protein Ancab_036057 [Ancistrocladus abbreviatus]